MYNVFLYLINVFCAIPSAAIQLIFVCKTVSIRQPKRYVFLCLLMQVAIWTVNVYFFPELRSYLEFAVTVVIVLFTVYWAEKKQRIAAGLVVCVYLAAQFFAAYILMYLTLTISEVTGLPADALVTPKTIPYALMSLVNCCFGGSAMWICYLLIKRLLPQLHFSRELLLLLPVPFSQAVLVNLVLGIMPYGHGLRSVQILLAASILLCIVADFCFFMGFRKMNQNSQLKAQIQMAEERFNTQLTYYTQLQENILSINQIRHDLNNQLQVAYALIERGEQAQVRCQLDMIQEHIRSSVGPRFCANLMVDAVLSDKAAVCRDRGIQLDINTQLPADMPIEGAHLCSAFSNLLDNSIQGAMACQELQKRIELRAALYADYLVIHCCNTSDAPIVKETPKHILRQHGLGLDILRKIAKEYNGSLDTAYKDGVFETHLILKFKT